MKFGFILSLIWVTVLSQFPFQSAFAGYSGPNRITAPADPQARCAGRGVNPETCEHIRKQRRAEGCISEEEYNKLREFGSYPNCTDFGNGPELSSWCSCGCFHPDTLISVFQKNSQTLGEVPAFQIAHARQNYQAVHLTPSSRISHFSFLASDLNISTEGIENRPLVVIQTENGKTLKLTTQHPILTAEGKMIKASQLQFTDLLIAQNGLPLKITSLQSEPYSGPVVNFMVDQDLSTPLSHVIFAEGIAVGDLAWQASLEDEQNQIFIRQ